MTALMFPSCTGNFANSVKDKTDIKTFFYFELSLGSLVLVKSEIFSWPPDNAPVIWNPCCPPLGKTQGIHFYSEMQ